MLRLDTLGFRVFPLASGCSVRHDLRHGWHYLQRVGDDWKAYVTSLARLTLPQIRMLTFLDDGQAYDDSVGRELDEFGRGNSLEVADRLVARGLVEFRVGPSVGRSFSAWYRLTPEGRRVRENGN